jgi:hypothetical protein
MMYQQIINIILQIPNLICFQVFAILIIFKSIIFINYNFTHILNECVIYYIICVDSQRDTKF